jgi:magnesium chelatase subunit D
LRFDALLAFARDLGDLFADGAGARVGETTVASRRVHVIDPANPSEVKVKCSADAGKVFYGRPGRDEVIHLDIFHALADIDHHRVAAGIRRAVDEYARDSGASCRGLADLIDVQTATGGGRVTGSLRFGCKASLRLAHRGHVHVAAMLGRDTLGAVYYIVRETERVIVSHGVELRRVDRVHNDRSTGGQSIDLSPYTAQTDSLLRADGEGDGNPNRSSEMKEVIDACQDFGSVSSFQAFLDCVASSNRRESPYAHLEREFGDAESMLAKLRALDVVNGEGPSLEITEKGKRIREFLRKFAREVETELRKLIRRAARPSIVPIERTDFSSGRVAGTGLVATRLTLPASEAFGQGSIAVAETVCAWAGRCATEGRRTGFEWQDVRVELVRSRPRVDVCLLIDASASMAGKRIQAAKHLARYLFLTCRDRVSVLTFQDRHVTHHVIRARSAKALEMGLATVRPAGLTPLAAGIVDAVKLLARNKTKPTLLVLLTDGIPTMNQWTGDPARDSLVAAEQISKYNIPFTCIGLAPNKGFLRKLAEIARGTLYIVDEFDRDLLAKVVRDERDRVPS